MGQPEPTSTFSPFPDSSDVHVLSVHPDPSADPPDALSPLAIVLITAGGVALGASFVFLIFWFRSRFRSRRGRRARRFGGDTSSESEGGAVLVGRNMGYLRREMVLGPGERKAGERKTRERTWPPQSVGRRSTGGRRTPRAGGGAARSSGIQIPQKKSYHLPSSSAAEIEAIDQLLRAQGRMGRTREPEKKNAAKGGRSAAGGEVVALPLELEETEGNESGRDDDFVDVLLSGPRDEGRARGGKREVADTLSYFDLYSDMQRLERAYEDSFCGDGGPVVSSEEDSSGESSVDTGEGNERL